MLGGGGVGAYFLFSGNSGHGGAPGTPGSGSASGATGTSLGDLRTLDPCGLIRGQSYAREAATSTDTHQVLIDVIPIDMATCKISVTASREAGGIVDVSASIVVNADISKVDPSKGTITSQGALKIIKVTPAESGPNNCERAVYLPDHTLIDITATPRNDSANGLNFCEFADIATADVVSTVEKHQERTIQIPDSSALGLNICSLLDTLSVSSTLNMSDVESLAGPGNHQCQWGNRSDKSSGAQIGIYLPTYRKDPSLGYERITIDGRDSYIEKPPGERFCQVSTAVRTWNPWPGVISQPQAFSSQPKPTNQIIEYVDVDVFLPDQDQACQAAQQLAARAWSKLPPAS